jgi:hypothetical protein
VDDGEIRQRGAFDKCMSTVKDNLLATCAPESFGGRTLEAELQGIWKS